MSNLTAVVNNIISKVNTHTTDLSNKTTQIATHISGITSYHLLQGNLAVSNSTTTQGFNTTLYTGNGSTQSITTGIDMSTQWGNTAEERFGGLVWIKNRGVAQNNRLIDTVRGSNVLFSNTTQAQLSVSGLFNTTNTGFSLSDSHGDWNTNTNNYASWNFQTTHRVSGTTNHGQAYECHYNPFTGFTIVKYTGSGLAGHEIPHMLGRKLGFATFKNLSAVSDWFSVYLSGDNYIYLNLITASQYSGYNVLGDTNILLPNSSISYNTASNTYIMYGWANSYFDKANKLIGNYEIGVYQGTGVSGNKVPTRGKPAWVMIKRIDSATNWQIVDNQRGSFDLHLEPNLSNAEVSVDHLDVISDGFIMKSSDATWNASGGQYLYIVAYDTNANGGGSYYPLASDIANVQVNNALIPIAQGIDSNGAKNTILSKNETFSGVTYTQGKNYPYYDALGNRGVSVHKPRYLESELVRTYAGESPDYFNVKENKWYSTNSGSELVTNGTFTSNTTGWTATTGFTISAQNNSLKMDRNIGTPTGGVYQNISTTIGKKYKVTLDILYISGGGLTIWVDSGNTLSTYIATTGKQVVEFIANNSSTKLEFLQHGVAQTGTINLDNISVFETAITPTTEITNGRNYLNHIVYADNDGGVLYVEELPKIEYKDIVKANEFQGKNACTAWVNFDGTTTPPTIRDSHNVSSVVRLLTGNFDIYFKTPMNNTNYTWNGTGDYRLHFWGQTTFATTQYLNKVSITVQAFSTGAGTNPAFADITIFGGNN